MPTKKSSGPKKLRVYEVAKELGMSSEAVLKIVRRLGVEVKNHMSTLLPEAVQKVKDEMAQEKTAVREEMKHKQEAEQQRAREQRQQTKTTQQQPSSSAPASPQRPSRPSRPSGARDRSRPGGGGGRPSGGGGGGGPRSLARPEPPRARRRDRKRKRQVDTRAAAESVRKTLASLGTGTTKRRYRRRDEEGGADTAEAVRTIKTAEFVTVADLANLLQVKPQEVIATCMRLGLMATINMRLDKDSIEAIADEFEHNVEFASDLGTEEIEEEEIRPEDLQPRAPVVTIMGHVDHGKTSLLDYIRKTNVIAGEAGGITQHIGAYDVELPDDKKICFLDTPGHEAFTAMRARGAQVTDIVVLVVAADDRVMPQTIEAIDHAKAAEVPIIVAVNKIDLPDAQPERVKQELAGHGVVVEGFGGKYVSVDISAKKGTNIDKLLDMILLSADLLDLKADPSRRVRGVVLEARVEQGRGIVASVLVQQGTLEVGHSFAAGGHAGRVRAMFDERRHPVKAAGPSTPVEVLGWDSMPQAGDILNGFEDERAAREVAGKRQAVQREHEHRAQQAISLAGIHERMAQGELNELKLVIRGDVQGSVEALAESLGKLSNEEVQVRVIRQAAGQITEQDVMLASTSGAIIVGFHVRPDPRAREAAEREKVEIRYYDVIYKAVEEVKQALEGLLKPELKEQVKGSAEVRELFKLSKGVVVAGCMVISGTVTRSSKVRLLRDGVNVWSGRIDSLRRFKDDVREVANGFECGISLEGMNDVKVGDVIEAYTIEEIARTLA